MPILITCDNCGTQKYRKEIKVILNSKYLFCSIKCRVAYRRAKTVISKPCQQCGKMVDRYIRHTLKSKTKFIFCDKKCWSRHTNTHKTTGYRVSKIEKFIRSQLEILYPNVNFIFNGRETINSELDIYLPEYKIAFELNGIFHYEPIHGNETLLKIENNDKRKFQACLEKDIELVTIDVSAQKYFKEKTSMVYLDIIKQLIDRKLRLFEELVRV